MAAADTTIRVRVKDEASDQIKRIGAGVSSFANDLAAIGGSAAVAGLLTAAAALKQMVGALDDLDEAAQNAAISATALADLRLGAREAGVGSEELDKALAKLNVRLADARAGGAESQRIFKALGLNFRDTGLTAEDALGAMAKAFQGWQDGAEKLAFAATVLGEKMGPRFVAYLNQGAEGLKRFADLPPEAVAAAAKLQTEIDRLGVAWERLKNVTAGAILPGLNDAVDKVKSINWDRVLEPMRDGKFMAVPRMLQNLSIEAALAENRIKQLKQALELLPEGGVPDPNLRRYLSKPTAPAVGVDPKPVKFDDSFLSRAQELDKQLRALQGISEVERVLFDLENGSIKVRNEGERQYLLQMAAGLDAYRERTDAIREEAATRERAMETAVRQQERLNELTGRTAANRVKSDLALLDDAYFSGKISGTEYDAGQRRLFGITDEVNKALDKQKSLVEEIGLTFTSAFEDAIASGNGMRGVLKGLYQDLLRLLTRKLITEPLGNALMGALKGFNFAGIFGGARAGGGPVAGGVPYLVGEKGPELFVPSVAGTVVPNGAGVGGVSVVIQQTIDARSDIATIRMAGQMAVAEAKRQILASQQRRGAFA